MRPKVSHKKSRSGCVQCKRRRVKCGEEGCPCNNCTKRGITCTYSTASSEAAPVTTSCRTRNVFDLESDRTCGGSPSLNRQEELCLVHHFTTFAHRGLSSHNRDMDAWRDLPFLDGSKYEFVLDAVLAFAALHKASHECTDSAKYTSACIHYQARCLREYQARLDSIDDNNCHAMFAVSALMNIMTIAMSRGGPSLLPTSILETLFTSYNLLKGLEAVFTDNWKMVEAAHYRIIFNTPTVSEDALVSDHVSQAMNDLRRRAAEIVKDTADPENFDVYCNTIDKLQEHFRKFEQSGNYGIIVSWLLSIGDSPMKLLGARDPMMLLIFAHYGVLYLNMHDRWWAHDFGRRIIIELSDRLHERDPVWFVWTSWSREQAARLRDVTLVN